MAEDQTEPGDFARPAAPHEKALLIASLLLRRGRIERIAEEERAKIPLTEQEGVDLLKIIDEGVVVSEFDLDEICVDSVSDPSNPQSIEETPTTPTGMPAGNEERSESVEGKGP